MSTNIDFHSRVFGLDLLRAYAIFCVVYAHGYSFVPAAIPKVAYEIPALDGVTMFFVLSGFLIGRILLKTVSRNDFDGKKLLDFWVRRWFRTLPNYFLVLIILVLVWSLTGRSLPSDLYKYFIFSQNLASPHPDFFAEAWSLAIEEWFYFLVPLFLFFAVKRGAADRREIVLTSAVACIAIVTAFRVYRAYTFGFSDIASWDQNLRKQVITRFDSLMYGVLGAYLSMYARARWQQFSGIAGIAGVALLIFDKVCYAAGNYFYLNYFQLSVASIGTLLLLPFLSSFHRMKDRFTHVVTLISLISYSMYLVNLTLIQSIISAVHKRAGKIFELGASGAVAQYLIYWIFTLLGSYLLWRYFEHPMTSLRERFKVRYAVANSSDFRNE